jgi:hypothetical protein
VGNGTAARGDAAANEESESTERRENLSRAMVANSTSRTELERTVVGLTQHARHGTAYIYTYYISCGSLRPFTAVLNNPHGFMACFGMEIRSRH